MRNVAYHLQPSGMYEYHFKVRCLETGGYLANLETLEEAMFLKNVLTKMKSGNTAYWKISNNDTRNHIEMINT